MFLYINKMIYHFILYYLFYLVSYLGRFIAYPEEKLLKVYTIRRLTKIVLDGINKEINLVVNGVDNE